MKRRIVKLGDVCEIKSGGTPSRSKPEYWKDGTIPWIKIGDINGKNVSSSSEFITNLGLNNSSTKLFKKGTVLYTIFATLGEVGILDIDATTNQAIAGILPPDELDKNYLYYFLKSKKDFVTQIGRGVAQNNINLSILRNFEIELLPIDHQIKIVNILDQAQELIDKRKAQIEALDELIQSVFYEMFGDVVVNNRGWKQCSINDVLKSKSKNGLYVPKNLYGKGVKMVHMSNVFNNIIDPTELKLVNISQQDIDTYALNQNDILIARRSLNIEGAAKPCLIPDTEEPVVFESSLIRLCLNLEIIKPIYLFYYLSNKYVRSKYLNQYITKSTIAGINNTNLNKVTVILPPIELQKQFAEVVEGIEKQKELLNESLVELENNFNSLMQGAFNGGSLR